MMPTAETRLEKLLAVISRQFHAGGNVGRSEPVDPIPVDPENAETRSAAPGLRSQAERRFILSGDHAPPRRVAGIAQADPGEQLLSNDRVNTVGADQQIADSAAPVGKVNRGAILHLIETNASRVQVNSSGRQSREQDAMQIGAMDSDRRLAECLFEFTRFGLRQCSTRDRAKFTPMDSGTAFDHRIGKIQLSQRPDGVWPDRQTGAGFSQFGRLFIHGRVSAGLSQSDSSTQSADTAPDNDCLLDHTAPQVQVILAATEQTSPRIWHRLPS